MSLQKIEVMWSISSFLNKASLNCEGLWTINWRYGFSSKRARGLKNES